jgi:hypothetical protein
MPTSSRKFARVSLMDAESCDGLEAWIRDEAMRSRNTASFNRLIACADELARLRAQEGLAGGLKRKLFIAEEEVARLRQRVEEAEKLIHKVLKDEHEAGWSLGLDWLRDAKAWRSLSHPEPHRVAVSSGGA